ncbi:MAG: metallophosphoesterase [Phycisphaerales bacterium]|nr:MAG: metallophosphoesterase [Phycisphaerales bacterium]
MSNETQNRPLSTTDPDARDWIIARRHLLKVSAGSLAGLAVSSLSCTSQLTYWLRPNILRFGMVTDVHYADADTVGSRFYRESLEKLGECVRLMNSQNVDFLVELGDFKDQDNPAVEQRTLSHLEAVERIFQQFRGPTYHVLGNHDEDRISKTQFLARVENTNVDPRCSYYSFDCKGVHFVVLDANYRADGANYDRGNFDWTDANVPPAELAWLEQDLAAVDKPVIIFIHQLLDGTGDVYVNNAGQVRRILEESGKVLAVFQGHHHSGSYSRIRGIHYYTLKALVEGPGRQDNSYAVVAVRPDRSIAVSGYRKAQSKHMSPDNAATAGQA